MNHDPASKMSRLSEFWISKASAKQRAGRAGRTGPGECFRLYSKNEFDHFHDFAIPEIQRAPLEPLLLQIKAMDLGDPRLFDYIEVVYDVDVLPTALTLTISTFADAFD